MAYKRGAKKPPSFRPNKRKAYVPRRRMRMHYAPKIFNFTRYCEKDVRLGADATPSGQVAVQFAMSDLNNTNDFISLFDQYKIDRVLYRFYISRNVDLATTVANRGAYPRLRWVHDFDDTTPLNFQELSEYPGMKSWQFGDSSQRTKWFCIAPAKLQEIYRLVTSAYQPVWGGYLDTTYNNVPHYGVKFAFDNLFTGVNLIMECKYVMSFKNPR